MAAKTNLTLAGPTRPLGSPDIPQFHLPGGAEVGVFTPRVYGAATIHFADRRRHVDETRRVAFIAPIDAGARTIDWDAAQPTTVMPDQLLPQEPARGTYLPLPNNAMKLPVFTRWAKAFDRWLARTQRIDVVAKQDQMVETITVGPKRGGVSVELVAIVWELAPAAGTQQGAA